MTAPSHGGGRKAAPAARGARRFGGVWAPVLLKLAGILFGMLALAAIGASSIARGSGVPAAAASGRATAGLLAAGSLPIATSDDAGPSQSDAGTSDASPPPSGLTPDGKVILNAADATELCRLPGVGPKRADAILALRTRLGGRFKRVTDLLRVKGIGVRTLKKMEPHLVLDRPKPPPDSASEPPPARP